MKRTILIASLVLSTAGAIGQCVPNQLYADSIFGVWPDTTENFAPGVVNVFYSDTLTILVPSDAGLINPDYSGVVIDSVALTGVDGLPAGFSVICNSQTAAPCTFLTSQLGCGLIEGMPTVTGTYDLTINVLAYAFGGFLQVPQAFSGYRIVITEDNAGVHAIGATRPMDVRAVPNPVVGSTSFQFNLARATKARVRIFDLLGERIWDRTASGRAGSNAVGFDASGLESGMYIYSVEAGGQIHTGRLVVN